jgi:hypothetical protein
VIVVFQFDFDVIINIANGGCSRARIAEWR